MADQSLSNINQTQFDAAEQTLIALIRTAYPSLDMRKGTVIRDLLIRPAAAVYALNTGNLETLTNKMSLVTLEQDATATADDYNKILANFGAAILPGTLSSGQAMVVVDSSREYNLGANTVFTDINGKQYQTLISYTVKPGATGTDISLNSNSDGSYYFILPVTAITVGVDGNIQQGTALTPTLDLFGFLYAQAYSNFSGGKDEETIDQATLRLPASLSYRALESTTSIDAKLRDAFASSGINIEAMAVSGYGFRSQIRDQHNPMGFSVGSRVDLYIRTYTTPRIVTLKKTGTRVGPTSYRFIINASEVPGYSVIRSISEVEAVVAPTLSFGTLTVIGSYPFTEVRSAADMSNAYHDIDPENSMVETAYTAFQQAVIVVSNVPAGTDTHDFKLELYAADGIQSLQSYVDNLAVRNVESDYIVRSPLMCLVGIKTTVYCSAVNPVAVSTLQTALASYINGRSFVNQLTRSELVKVMLSAGATRVDLGVGGMQLFGAVRDAAGVVHVLSGDSLNVEAALDPDVLLAPETTVFATELSQLNIEVVTE